MGTYILTVPPILIPPVNAEVISHLAGPTYLKYVNFTGKAKPAKATTLPRTATTTAATTAAAVATEAENGVTAAAQEVHADGTTANAAATTIANAGIGAGSGSGVGSGSVNIIVAKYGARALENGGPLQDLRAILYQYMRPWRPSQTLHIGLVDPLLHSFPDAQGGGGGDGGGRFVDHKQLYFQWCTLSPEYEQDPKHWVPAPAAYQYSMKRMEQVTEFQMVIPDEVAFSEACETVYVGVLFG